MGYGISAHRKLFGFVCDWRGLRQDQAQAF